MSRQIAGLVWASNGMGMWIVGTLEGFPVDKFTAGVVCLILALLILKEEK